MYNGENVSYTTDRFNNPNSALNFTFGYYQVPAGYYFYGPFTLSVWIYPKSIGYWGRIIDFGSGKNSFNIVFSYNNGTHGYPTFKMFQFNQSFNASKSPLEVPLNSWSFLVVTYEDLTLKMYYNASLIVQDYYLPTIPAFRNSCFIGRSNWLQDKNANIYLDELRIYDRALGYDEIKDLSKI